MTDTERVEWWKQKAYEYRRIALGLQGRLDGWTPEQLTAITSLIEGHDLFDPWSDLSRSEFTLCLNMNDTFYWGTADGEEITPEDAVVVYQVAQKFGADGVTAWVAHRRGYEPQIDSIRKRERYQKAYAFLGVDQ